MPARMLALAFAWGGIVATPALASGPAPLASQGCLGCHGPNGAGSQPVPALAGRSAADLRAAMMAFRANERPATIMGRIARGYTEAEIAEIAEYFSRQR